MSLTTGDTSAEKFAGVTTFPSSLFDDGFTSEVNLKAGHSSLTIPNPQV